MGENNFEVPENDVNNDINNLINNEDSKIYELEDLNIDEIDHEDEDADNGAVNEKDIEVTPEVDDNEVDIC